MVVDKEAAEVLAKKSIDNPRAQEILLKVLPQISLHIGELYNQKLQHRKKGKRKEEVREEKKAYFNQDFPRMSGGDHCPQCANLTKEQFKLRDQRSELSYELSELAGFTIDKEETKLARRKLELLLKVKTEE